MKIKTKLTLNVAMVMLVISAVMMTSIVGMGSVKKKLVYLTERSTPFQIRTLEFQKALQTATADLFRASSADSSAEYRTYRAETKKTLDAALKAESSQTALKGDIKTEVSAELKQIGDELFKITEERLKAEEAAASAAATVIANLKGSADRLRSLDKKVRVLQQQRSAAYSKSLDETKDSYRRMQGIESLKQSLKDLQMGILEIQRGDSTKRILIGRGKAYAALDKVAKSDYAKQSKGLALEIKGLREKVDELAKTQKEAMGQAGGELKGHLENLESAINGKITAITLAEDNEDFAAADKYGTEMSRQATLLAQMNSASELFRGNAELLSLGLSLDGLAAHLLMAQSDNTVNRIDAEIRNVFTQIEAVGAKLRETMTKSNASAELADLKKVQGDLATIRGLLTGGDGIVSRIRQKLTMEAKARQIGDKMRQVVAKQAQIGKESIDSASGEQEKAIATTNRMVGNSTALILIISIGAIILGIGFGIWIYRSIAKPLNQLLVLSGAIAQGDLTMNLEVKTRDEVGEVVSALNSMVSGLKSMIAKIKASSGEVDALAGQIAAGAEQLTGSAHAQASASDETSATMAQMAASIQLVANNTVSLASNADEVAASIQELGASSEQVATSAEAMTFSVSETSSTIEQMTVSIERVARSTDDLASSVTQTSTTIEQMTVSIEQVAGNSLELQKVVTDSATIIEQMAASINKVAKNVEAADEVARSAAVEGNAGIHAGKQAVEAMSRVAGIIDQTSASILNLGQRSEEIGGIIKVINGIADQTNLLALNAAIEAAHAGDAGKGFAVVAEEVRKLAERSMAATREIAQVIRQVQADTGESVKFGAIASQEAKTSMELTEVAGNAIENIVASIERTSGLMSDISRMTAEQAEASNMVILAVDKMNQATDVVANAAREQALGGKQIRQAVERMNHITQEVSGATREQASGSRQIRVAVETMNSVTGQVSIATKEQALSARQIITAVNDMNSMTQSVANATAEQKKGGAMVVTAMENISTLARENLTSVEQLARAAESLSQQAVDLAGMVAEFKVE